MTSFSAVLSTFFAKLAKLQSVFDSIARTGKESSEFVLLVTKVEAKRRLGSQNALVRMKKICKIDYSLFYGSITSLSNGAEGMTNN
uniref:Uncharacterized protein n=1 Tax=Physcomitrium patens TaxID=3218 RepID=A0A2K1IXX7_PHYPA|nr:hypothetical protein PHYPA_023956 [Physcomitrium patens]